MLIPLNTPPSLATRPRVLELFAGAGGAAVGLRAHFEARALIGQAFTDEVNRRRRARRDRGDQ